MANRLYIYTCKKASTSSAVDTIIEAKYELPIYFYPLFINKPKVVRDSIFASTAEGVAFFTQFYNFIENHAERLIDDLAHWQAIRVKLDAEMTRLSSTPWLMLEMSDVFTMSDTPPKVQAEEQLAQLERYNGIIQDAMDANNPQLLDQLIDYRTTGLADFKTYLNYENYAYGWEFCEAQWRKDDSEFPVEFEQAGKLGLKDKNGQVVAPAEYDSLYAFAENTRLCVAEKAGKFCYLTTQGKVEFGAYFDDLYDFFDAYDEEDQLAIAAINHQHGLINRKGQWVVEPKWDDMRGLYDRGGLIAYKKDNVWGVMDDKGNVIQAPQFPYKPMPNDEYSTRYYTCGPDDGEPVLYLSLNWKPFQLKKNETIGSVDGGNNLRTSLGEGKHAKYGLTNKDAQTLLECIYDDLEYEYDLHVYRVKTGKKWGIFHPHQGWILPCDYDTLSTVRGEFGSSTGSAHSQCWVARKGRQYGLYDSLKQAWVLDCTHGKITPFSKNVVGVVHTQPPEEAGIWVHNASTGERLAGPYESLSDGAGTLSFAAVLAFTKNQVLTVGQTGIVKPLTEHQADELERHLPNDIVGEYYFTHAQATIIKNFFSPRKRAEALNAQAYQLEQAGKYQQAADMYVLAGQAGNANGYVNAGFLFASQPTLENLPLARHYYELATEAGNSMGMNNLADCYRYGTGGEQNMPKALALFHQAEALNNLRAAWNLADIYYNDATLEDHAQALKYYLKAYREFPYPLEVGYLYDTLLKDYTSALGYYEKAGKSGSGYAYNRIGLMWEEGLLGKVNLKKAQDYYQKAMKAENSEAYAGLNLAKLLVSTDPVAAKAAWQFALAHENEVEGLTEFGQAQGWA